MPQADRDAIAAWINSLDPLDARIFENGARNLARLQAEAVVLRRLADDLTYGSDTSRFVGSGIDFAQARPFAYGDSVRHIDWRVTARAGQPVTESVPVTVPAPDPALPAHTRRRTSIHWARLLARIYEIRPLTCPRCHGEMRLIAFLTANRQGERFLLSTSTATLAAPTSPSSSMAGTATPVACTAWARCRAKPSA